MPRVAGNLERADIAFRIDSVERGDALTLVVEGELDIASCPLLDSALEQARATDAAEIVVDLLAVRFMDSSGLHVLIRHTQSGDGRPRIRLTKSTPQVQRVFELSGAVHYLPFVPE